MGEAGRYRYRPFWLLGVLALAIAAYGAYWVSMLAPFRSEVGLMVAGDAAAPFRVQSGDVSYSGFPYRLEARLGDVSLVRQRPDYELQISSSALYINRQPWKPMPYVLHLDAPVLRLVAQVPALSDVELRAESARGSLRYSAAGVERLSLVFENATLKAPGILSESLTFDKLQVHARETAVLRPARGRVAAPADQTAADQPAEGPTGGPFLEVLLRAERMAVGQGAPMTLLATLEANGDPGVAPGAPFLEAWREAGGTLNLLSGVLSIGQSPMVQGEGSFALSGDGTLLGVGKFNSPCPGAAMAMMLGQERFEQRIAGPDGALPAYRAEGRRAKPLELRWQLLEGVPTFLLDAPIDPRAPDQNPDARCPALRQ